MGYLINNVITVDAILTKKGRELLARSDGSFRISKFALSDDEIDYTLFNSNHPSGSAYYGEAIEAMPLIEAFPDETQIMKYKLVTLPRGTAKMPILGIGQESVILKQTEEKTISPSTFNYLGNNQVVESEGYTFIISDVRLFSSFLGSGINTENATQLNQSQTFGTNVSKTVIGTTLNLKATGVNLLFQNTNSITTTLTVIGNSSGARIQIPVIINKTI
jgi:hypothetical protein